MPYRSACCRGRLAGEARSAAYPRPRGRGPCGRRWCRCQPRQGGRSCRNSLASFGTRLDLQEALDFAAQGKVEATVATDKLENINDVFARLHEGEGRVVLDLAA